MLRNKQTHPYLGLKASLLTQHGKESVIAPELFISNHLEVVHVTGYDTDQLGTFTRDVPRYGSQLDAARKKARMGMALSGLPLGIASEGAFANDPYTGMLPWNYELLVLIDDHRHLEMVGFFSGPAQSASKSVANWDELSAFLSPAQFPSHQLVIRPDDEYHPDCRKGIQDQESLRAAFIWARQLSPTGRIFVENDLRAHTNPTRMAHILKATQDLASKMQSLCPKCVSPGYWITEIKKGLPCSLCSAPTPLPTAHIWSCIACGYQHEDSVNQQQSADPAKCNFCNP